MPHIHTQPGQHDHSATAFIVRTDFEEPKILLHQHKKLNSLLPPGGHIELNETPWAALAHEIEEETGYVLSELEIVQPKHRMRKLTGIILHPIPLVSNTHDIPGDHYHSDLDYLLIATAAAAKPPGEGEVAEMVWLSSEEVRALSSDEIYDNTREIALYALNEVLHSPAFERQPATDYRIDRIVRS